ncbi:MAG TPA: PIN domain-containing protein [Candidatus Saccharimonadales bacterium]|nr:PIN domain-containing protein [Candidatus Saccharimonadales bacterium]
MVFLDANILLELILPDRKQAVSVDRTLAGLAEPTAISMLSLHLVYHFGRKAGIQDVHLRAVLAPHELLSSQPADYEWALEHEDGVDFEDALQLAAALRAGCERFMTLDQALARRYGGQPVEFIVPRAS